MQGSGEIPLVEDMHLASEERPAELSAFVHCGLSAFFGSSSAGKLDLPTAEVIQKAHVRF